MFFVVLDSLWRTTSGRHLPLFLHPLSQGASGVWTNAFVFLWFTIQRYKIILRLPNVSAIIFSSISINIFILFCQESGEPFSTAPRAVLRALESRSPCPREPFSAVLRILLGRSRLWESRAHIALLQIAWRFWKVEKSKIGYNIVNIMYNILIIN